MKPPIICNDSPNPEASGDLSVYDSVEWAERANDPYNAKDPCVQAYDCEGRLLRMIPDWDASCVRLEAAEDEPTHLDRVTGLLRDYLPRIGAPAELAAGSLEEMLHYVYEYDPNPYTSYRKPGTNKLGWWRRLIDGFTRQGAR